MEIMIMIRYSITVLQNARSLILVREKVLLKLSRRQCTSAYQDRNFNIHEFILASVYSKVQIVVIGAE